MALDPIIDALLEHLPAPGDYWPVADRKKWLQLIELAFDIVYDEQPHETGDAEPSPKLHPHGG